MAQKSIPECHYDMLGSEIRPGVYIAVPIRGNKSLAIFVVNRITNKMVNVSMVGVPDWMVVPKNIFPSDVIVVDQEKALMYILKA